MSQYAKVPIEAISDERLFPRQFRVLCALLSFADKNGDCNPSKRQISERSGVDEKHISETTARLVEHGWLLKTGTGGKSKSAHYRITNPHKTSPIAGLESTTETSPTVGAKPAPRRVKNQPQDRARSIYKTSPTVGLGGSPTVGLGGSPTVGLGKEQTIEQTNEHSLRADSRSDEKLIVEKSAAKKTRLTPEMREACARTWEAYSLAYLNRYGVEPVKNAKVAGQVVNFVRRIGQEEAPAVSSYFVGHSSRWYVQVAHSVDALLKDAEKLRMEWATNRKVTSASAMHADKREAAGAAVSEYMANLEARYGTA